MRRASSKSLRRENDTRAWSALVFAAMAKPTDVTVRCAGCGRVLAIYSEVAIDGARRARLLGHARDLLEWHRSPDCHAPNAIVGEKTRSR
jgi:hypothetical protein